MQAEREAAAKAAAAAGEEVERLKRKLQEAGEEMEAAMRRHLADQQRVHVCVHGGATPVDTDGVGL